MARATCGGQRRPRLTGPAVVAILAMTAAACGGTATPTAVGDDTATERSQSEALASTDETKTPDGESAAGESTDGEPPGGQSTDMESVDPDDATAPGVDNPLGTAPAPGCLATSAADGVNVSWWGLRSAPGGLSLDILGDGQVLIQAGDQVEGVLTLFGAPPEPGMEVRLKARSEGEVITLECGTAGTLLNLPIPNCTIELTGGKPQLMISYDDGSAGPLGRTVIRDGEPIDASFSGPNPIDTSAEPGTTYTYQIEMSDSSDRAPAIGDCGSITVPEPGDRSTELLAAREIFTTTALGPHAYFTVLIEGDSLDYYMQALGADGHVFVPPLSNAELLNPFTIHDELIEAINAGREVDYQLDASSGLPIWWTVDDQTTKFACFEVDTAPPDLRVGPCNPETDLIGR